MNERMDEWIVVCRSLVILRIFQKDTSANMTEGMRCIMQIFNRQKNKTVSFWVLDKMNLFTNISVIIWNIYN